MKNSAKSLALEPTALSETGIDLLFHRMAKSGKRKWEKYVPVREKDCVDTFKGQWENVVDECGKVEWS